MISGIEARDSWVLAWMRNSTSYGGKQFPAERGRNP